MIILDSTVLMDNLRGLAAAGDYLRSVTDVPACSEITRVEILRGLRGREGEAAEGLFSVLRWIPLDERIARRAGELGERYRSSHGNLALADLVIGATALELDAALATLNVRHFPMIPGLKAPY